MVKTGRISSPESYDDLLESLNKRIESSITPLVDVLEQGVGPSLQPVVTSLRQTLRAAVMTQTQAGSAAGEHLAPRELQILNMVSSGFSSKEIAAALNVSPATVVNTRKRIRRKLHISGQACDLAATWRAMQG